MNQLAQEWVDKAESDFRTATREIQVTLIVYQSARCCTIEPGIVNQWN
jgi:hypothetical protein